MKKMMIFLLTLISISAYGQSTKELTFKKPTAIFQNENASLDNSYNWSPALNRFSLAEQTRGIIQAELQVVFNYGGIIDRKEGLQVGDVQFNLSKVDLSRISEFKVTITEAEGKLSTPDGVNVRQFYVRVQYKDMRAKVNDVFPVTIDAEGNINSFIK